MSDSGLPQCPKCGSAFTYEDGGMYVCPECAHEWGKDAVAESAEEQRVVKDANGTVLNDGIHREHQPRGHRQRVCKPEAGVIAPQPPRQHGRMQHPCQ